MLTLGLDTTTGWGCLGLLRDQTVLAETVWRVDKNQAEQFLPVLAETMARAGLAPAALDLIAVGCGPGSYTGLRIGLAMGEALAFTLDRPVTGVSTLAALAANASDSPGPVCAAVTARRGEVYAAVYKDGRLLVSPAPFLPEALLGRLAALGEKRVLVLGNGADLLRAIPVSQGISLIFGHPEQDCVRGASVARLGAANPLARPCPIYLRRTEAEERLATPAPAGAERTVLPRCEG